MGLRNLVRGYVCLVRHRNIPGYRNLPFHRRLMLDHLALWRWIKSVDFWRIILYLTALILAVEVICMELEIQGTARTMLRSLPPLAAVPLVAIARRRNLRALLRERVARGDGPRQRMRSKE